LHWLPVAQCKVVLMVFDCMRGQGPQYLNNALAPVQSVGARARLYDRATDMYFALWTMQFPLILANCVKQSSI